MSNLVEIVLDCRHPAGLARFWEVALGWQVRPYDQAEIARLATRGLIPETDPSVAVDSPGGSLVFFLQEVPEGKFGEPRTAPGSLCHDPRRMYNACMAVALQIRNVPDEVRDALVERASQLGQSMQAFLLDLVQREAQLARNANVFERTARSRTILPEEYSPEHIIREGRDAGFDVDRADNPSAG